MHCRQVIFSCHFCAFRRESMMGGRIAFTAFALMALAIARAAACASVLTAVILSPTAARTEGKRTTRYGSTAGEIDE